jgi:hypothetical protein
VVLLPGFEKPLLDSQIKKAFNHGMPEAWKGKFITYVVTFSTITRNQMIRYIREQDVLSDKIHSGNEAAQKKNNASSSPRHAHKGTSIR